MNPRAIVCWLFVSSMRLTPAGLTRKIVAEDIFASLSMGGLAKMNIMGVFRVPVKTSLSASGLSAAS